MKKLLIFILILMMAVPFQVFANVKLIELPEKAKKDLNGIFEISVEAENKWINAGNLEFGKFQETKEIDLSKYLGGDNPLIKITQKGGGAAYLDSVLLDGTAPMKANNSEGKILNKLTKEDLDITPVGDGIVLEFSLKSGKGILSVTGRIENEIISQEPLQFPISNNYKQKNQIADFYSYKLNSNIGKITVDGVLDEVETMGTFAKEYQIPGSGHPAGDTYFWVMNDDENLYVTMDFTPDNTYDGDKDYAKVYVNSDEGIKEFKVSVPETNWGSAGFTYTDKVVYEHKVYEFLIPLSELGSYGNNLELAFSLYGTASLPDICLPRLAYDSDNGIYLSVYQSSVNNEFIKPEVYGQFVYKNNEGTETVCPEFLISELQDAQSRSEFPDIAYDSENKAFLVVWSGESSIDSTIVTVKSVDKDKGIIVHNVSTIETLYTCPEDGDFYVTNPAVAFDNKENTFLVVWEDRCYVEYSEYTNIKGMIFDLSKKPKDIPVITVSIPDYANDINPAVCYSKKYEAFLVVWKSQDEAPMIQANIISSTGSNTTPESFKDLIIIYQASQYAGIFALSVSINEANNEFLVTWGNKGGAIYGANVDLSKLSDIVSDPEKLTPEDSYSYHSTSFYDGVDSMVLLWNEVINDARYGFIKLKTVGQNEVRSTYNPERTDTYWGQQMFNFMDSCGNDLDEILVAYGRDPSDISDFIGYRFISDKSPEFIDESQPDLAYHSGLDVYLSVFTGDNYASDERESYIYGQLIDNKGEPIGEKFKINDGTDNEDPEDDGCLDLPSVAVDKNGDFLVAWTQSFDTSKIYASKVTIDKISKNSYDVQVGEPFRVSENNDYNNDNGWKYYNEYLPDIAYNSKEDNFLIVWTQYVNDSNAVLSKSGMDIYGSVVSFDGIIYSTFPVSRKANDNDQLDQGEASVCYSESDNRYIAAWTEVNIDTFSINAVVIGDDGEVYFDEMVTIAEDSLNSNVSYNTDKFLITWSNDINNEICGAYYNISGNYTEIIDEDFVISAVPGEVMYMSDVFTAAYFDGHDKMLCVWNPGEIYFARLLSIDSYDLYARLCYINYEGIAGNPFNTHEPETVKTDEPIAITGNMKGQFLIAYGTPKGYMYDEELYRIGYRLIGEFIPEPEEPGLEFVDAPYEVQVGKTIQAKVNYFDGIEYIDVTDDVFEYKSSNPEIATITSGGAITGVAVGKTTISASYRTYINDVPTTLSAIAGVNVYKKSEPRPSPAPEKPIIGQVIVDNKVIKNIYPEDLVTDGGIYSFQSSKTGDNAKLWLLGSYYKQIANKNPNGTLQLIWDAASYNLPLKCENVLKDANSISDSKVNIILEKVTDKKLIASAVAAVDKLSGKMVSVPVDFNVTIEGSSKTVIIDSYDLYVERTMDQLNKLDSYSTTAMKLILDDEVFTFAPSVFKGSTATIKYRGNGIFAVINNPKTFNDITNHWSKMNVEKLAARNIAFGKDESTFAPNDFVSRAEFAVMITRALGITEEEGTINFDDVKGWFEEDISTAYDAGLINGRSDGKFYPNDKIQRKDMAVMIHNAIKFADKEVTVKNTEKVLSMFADSAKIDEYAKTSTAICADAGIIMGRDTKEFDPDEYATRAEASAIIERMLRYLEFIN